MKEEMEEQPPKKTLNEEMQAEEPRELPSRPPRRPIPKLQQVQCGAHLCKYPLGLKERGLTASEEDEQEALALRAFWAGKENNKDLKTKIASKNPVKDPPGEGTGQKEKRTRTMGRAT